MTTATDAVREYIVDQLHIVVQNDEPTHERLREVARQAVVSDTATGLTFEDYRMALSGRGQTDRKKYVQAIAPAVREELKAILDEELPSSETNVVRLIVIGILDFGDSAQWEMFAELYLPDIDDVRDYFEDEDE